MLLGGLHSLLPVIKEAHCLGCHVITVDYVPGNIAHKYSDEYHNISILDKEAVLCLARELRIDGIMSFAVDPGVTTAAYVAERMGLPFQGPYESVCILQDKARFRDFLTRNGFNVPEAKGFSSPEEAIASADYFNWPVMVKPVDSAGSKGVSFVSDPSGLADAIDYALGESHSGRFIIEDYLEKAGCSSDSDSFMIDGKLVCCTFSDQWFDSTADNPNTPAAYSWPSTMPIAAQQELAKELQRLMTLLGMKTGIFNIETRLCTNGKPYIMEVTPRGGGPRLAEMVQNAAGIPLIRAAIKSALGETPDGIRMPEYTGHLAEIVVHSDCDGVFDRIEIAPEFKDRILETDIWVKSGDRVHGFSGANRAIGTVVARFDSQTEINDAIINARSWCKIKLQ